MSQRFPLNMFRFKIVPSQQYRRNTVLETFFARNIYLSRKSFPTIYLSRYLFVWTLLRCNFALFHPFHHGSEVPAQFGEDARCDGIIKNRLHVIVRSGRVAQLAEQLTLNQ